MKEFEGKVAVIKKARDLVFKVIGDGWLDDHDLAIVTLTVSLYSTIYLFNILISDI